MKIARVATIAFTFLGMLVGLLSTYFDLLPYLLFSLVIYLIPLVVGLKLLKTKKKRWLFFYNSFITFVLIWFVVWILLYNLG